MAATVPGPEPLHAKELASIETSQWNRCEILWTKTKLPPTDGEPSKTEPIEFYSMLPYGWVPSDGAELFGLFLDHLKDRWLGICNMARQCLSDRVIRLSSIYSIFLAYPSPTQHADFYCSAKLSSKTWDKN